MINGSIIQTAKYKGETLIYRDRRMDQLWHFHVMEYCLAMNEMSKPQKDNLINLMLSKRNQVKK